MLTVQDCLCWRLKTLEVDGWGFLKLTVLQVDMNCEHMLIGCQAFMRHATCHFLIGFCNGSKHCFVFRASLVYITHFSSLISTIFSQNILSERRRQPCQSVEHLYPSTIQPSTFRYSKRWVFIIIFSKSCILCLHFARPTHPSVTTRSASLRFCRQL